MDVAIKWMGFACFLAFLCSVLPLPILAIFRRTRRAAGLAYMACSFVFGGTLWIISAMTVYESWGLGALIVGLMIIGVGVVPMTLIIFAISSQWFLFGEVLLILLVAIGVRMFGFWLAEKAKWEFSQTPAERPSADWLPTTATKTNPEPPLSQGGPICKRCIASHPISRQETVRLSMEGAHVLDKAARDRGK
jgi:hypothetical protein